MSNDQKHPEIIISPDALRLPTAADFERLFDRKADQLYVVANPAKTTVVKDPGLERPFCTPNLKMAEDVARKVGGVVLTLADAIKTLMDRATFGGKN